MSWPIANATYEELLTAQPALAQDFTVFLDAIWNEGVVSQRLLELTRLRIAAIHDCEPEWAVRRISEPLDELLLTHLKRGDYSLFPPQEIAVLNIAEKIPFQPHEVTDEEIEIVKGILGEPAAISLLTAMSLFDATCRLKGIFETGD